MPKLAQYKECTGCMACVDSCSHNALQATLNEEGHIVPLIDESNEQILLSIQDDYKICKAAGKKLYHHLWIYTHGIATLCATKMCRFTDEEISTMITEVCMSILKKLKEGENND